MKRQVVIIFIATMAVFFCSSFLAAQEGRGNGRVAGVVQDDSNQPLEGVKITLQSMQYNFKLETVSNPKGRWSFYGFGVGNYRVIAEKEGYLRAISNVQLSGANRNPVQKIIMKPVSDIEEPIIKDDKTREQFRQGNALYKEGKYREALTLFQGFLQANPHLYKVGINVANCYFKLRKYDEAIAEYTRVLEGLKEENPELKGNKTAAQMYAGIGEAYMAQNKFKEAEINFKKSIEIDPEDYALAYNVAEIMFNANNVDEAIRYYQLAIKINPQWAKSYTQMGYAYLNKGDIPMAVEAFKKFLEVAPDDPQADVIRGLIKDLK